MPDEPNGGPPIALSPPTFKRHEEATRYVEGVIRTRPPRESRQRSPGYAGHAWGLLTSGSIGAGGGLTLGTGEVELCLPDLEDRATLLPTGEIVTVYNAGDEIVADGETVIPLKWIHGEWAVGDGGAENGGPYDDRCDCPLPEYEVEVECGSCQNVYGPYRMPRFWRFTITGADENDGPYADAQCPSTACNWLIGSTFLLEYQDVGPICTWVGEGRCGTVEMIYIGDSFPRWQITIVDHEACVLAVYTKADDGDFACCGDNNESDLDYADNQEWSVDSDSPCEFQFTLAPHECTCCPEPEECITADPGFTFCDSTDCCYISQCSIEVTVGGLSTPPFLPCTMFDDPCYTIDGDDCPFPVGDPGRLGCFQSAPGADNACGGMNGVYSLDFNGNCEWRFEGTPAGGSTPVVAVLTLAGFNWILNIVGEDGQTAIFDTDHCDEPWACERQVCMCFLPGGSSCEETAPEPSACFNLNLPGGGGLNGGGGGEGLAPTLMAPSADDGEGLDSGGGAGDWGGSAGPFIPADLGELEP